MSSNEESPTNFEARVKEAAEKYARSQVANYGHYDFSEEDISEGFLAGARFAAQEYEARIAQLEDRYADVTAKRGELMQERVVLKAELSAARKVVEAASHPVNDDIAEFLIRLDDAVEVYDQAVKRNG